MRGMDEDLQTRAKESIVTAVNEPAACVKELVAYYTELGAHTREATAHAEEAAALWWLVGYIPRRDAEEGMKN